MSATSPAIAAGTGFEGALLDDALAAVAEPARIGGVEERLLEQADHHLGPNPHAPAQLPEPTGRTGRGARRPFAVLGTRK